MQNTNTTTTMAKLKFKKVKYPKRKIYSGKDKLSPL